MNEKDKNELFKMYNGAIIDHENSYRAYHAKVNLKDNDKDGIHYFYLQYNRAESVRFALASVIEILGLESAFNDWQKQQIKML